MGFGSNLCAIHSLPSPGEKIEKDSVSLTALVGSQLCETFVVSWKSVRSCWRDPLVNCSDGGRSKYSKEMNQDMYLHLIQITAVQRKSECRLYSQAGILWPSDCRVQSILISFLLEASKLGEELLAVVRQERVNFLSKKYSSGGNSVLFLEMDKAIF